MRRIMRHVGGAGDGDGAGPDCWDNSACTAGADDAGAGEDVDQGQWCFRYVRDSIIMPGPASATCDRPSGSWLPQEQLQLQ